MLDDIEGASAGDRFQPALDLESIHDVADMPLDCAQFYHEFTGNRLVGCARDQQAQNLHFSCGIFTVLLPGPLLPFLHTKLPEEVGWTGILQTDLQRRYGPVRASIIVAPVFTIMHLLAYFVRAWISEERMLLSEKI